MMKNDGDVKKKQVQVSSIHVITYMHESEVLLLDCAVHAHELRSCTFGPNLSRLDWKSPGMRSWPRAFKVYSCLNCNGQAFD